MSIDVRYNIQDIFSEFDLEELYDEELFILEENFYKQWLFFKKHSGVVPELITDQYDCLYSSVLEEMNRRSLCSSMKLENEQKEFVDR